MTGTDYIVEEIRARLTMADLIGLYFPHLKPRGGRIPCPIHGGDNPNFSFRGILYNCFTCGAGGDIFTFVQDVFSLDFMSAIDKLNSDFCLGLVTDRRMTLREQREAEQKYQEILEKRAAQPATREDIMKVWLDLKKWIVGFDNYLPPKERDDEDAQLYAEAIKTLSYLDYVLDHDPRLLQITQHDTSNTIQATHNNYPRGKKTDANTLQKISGGVDCQIYSTEKCEK